MKLDRQWLQKVRDSGQTLPWTGQWLDKLALGSGLSLAGPVTANGLVSPEQADFRIRGQLAVLLQAVCDRCLQPTDVPLQIAVDVLFTSARAGNVAGDGGDDALGDPVTTNYLIASDGSIDLTPALHDALILGLPMKVLCQENCPGLCPRCGASLAAGPCGCREEEVDPRLAPLQALLAKSKGPF
ncbi:MAG: DUF177 domain-containing protein [Heliobacteriaceae bacterium]|nr:DUF177 domain-containing protein [Heliobacteriaceae bacterium]MDD4587004.1 DUF177 domain-containing protein [Heliobacteriaceae bacterium]